MSGDGPAPRTLRRRPEFLAANSGRRVAMPGFVLLVRPRGDALPAMGVGYTVTRKIGNAVVRNRMKRRLRSLARTLLPVHGVAGADHVLIGRNGGIGRDYGALEAELRKALVKAAQEAFPGEGLNHVAAAGQSGRRRGMGRST